MNNQTTNPVFHGSDIEKISACYHIKKEAIVNFAGNVNPLGLPASVKEAVATHADLFSSYPDREYLSLRNVLSNYCDVPADYIFSILSRMDMIFSLSAIQITRLLPLFFGMN